ncbi:unnamed protein product [Phytophthora fragariaefolia]|uniref:Unnamed protein product n=1 Tax=Phytophthora fragariaefolia TaxID=1490495 RepID=A0A9W6XSB4_9STRA|nr:unnamed protein product [Phytophthora fragariaefolia]
MTDAFLRRQFGGDPRKLVLVGHSAGAHLIMQILADPQYLKTAGLEQPVDAFVKGAVGISGVYNIVRLANASFYGSLVTTPPFGERVEQWREASVAMTVTRVGPTSPLSKMPLQLINAQEDFHFQDDTQELERWLVAAGNVRVQSAALFAASTMTDAAAFTTSTEYHPEPRSARLQPFHHCTAPRQ